MRGLTRALPKALGLKACTQGAFFSPASQLAKISRAGASLASKISSRIFYYSPYFLGILYLTSERLHNAWGAWEAWGAGDAQEA
jgi:hypothetical protein